MNRQEIQEILVLLKGAGIQFNRTQTPPQYPEWEFWEINYGSMAIEDTMLLLPCKKLKRILGYKRL